MKNYFSKYLLIAIGILSFQNSWATKKHAEPAKEQNRYREYRNFRVPSQNGQWVGIPNNFAQFCGGVVQGCYGGGMCGGGGHMLPPQRPIMPAPMPTPCGPMGCGGACAMGGCGGGMVYGGGYGFGSNWGIYGGLNLGEMSSDAQIVWGAAFGFRDLATRVTPYAFATPHQNVSIMDPYYMGSRYYEHTPRPTE